jgi:hypothetical protein
MRRDPGSDFSDQEIARQMKAFRAKGGKVQKIPEGVCKETPTQTVREANALSWRKRGHE